jgi:hypothetical protein
MQPTFSNATDREQIVVPRAAHARMDQVEMAKTVDRMDPRKPWLIALQKLTDVPGRCDLDGKAILLFEGITNDYVRRTSASSLVVGPRITVDRCFNAENDQGAGKQ